MGRNAVFNLNEISISESLNQLKKVSLLFDTIYIKDREGLQFTDNDRLRYKIPNVIWDKFHFENATLDYLIEKKIIEYFKIPFKGQVESLDQESKILFDKILPLVEQMSNYKEKIKNVKSLSELKNLGDAFDDVSSESTDLFVRMDVINLSKMYGREFIPILGGKESFKVQSKKDNIFHLLMKNIPAPGDDTPWEQIIDLKSDEETRIKYLALINWVNEIARSNFSINEIMDKYDYLYLDYKRSYERHKMKSTFSTLEIILAIGAGFLSPNIPMAFNLASDFLRIGTSTINLLKEESLLPGREIAYIYHANKKFNK